jgi:hypothetical protein
MAIELDAIPLAAIDDDVQQAAVAAFALGWLEQHEVGPEPHSAIAIARRFIQVGDARIGRLVRIDREVQLAIHALVVKGEGRTTGDFEMRNRHTLLYSLLGTGNKCATPVCVLITTQARL